MSDDIDRIPRTIRLVFWRVAFLMLLWFALHALADFVVPGIVVAYLERAKARIYQRYNIRPPAGYPFED